jgi:hypothetical protein
VSQGIFCCIDDDDPTIGTLNLSAIRRESLPQYKSIPIIAYTRDANVSREKRLAYSKAGVKLFLPYPFDSKLLISVVKHWKKKLLSRKVRPFQYLVLYIYTCIKQVPSPPVDHSTSFPTSCPKARRERRR